MGGSSIAAIRRFFVTVLLVDAAALLAAVLLAALLGEFTRTAVAMLTLIAGAICLIAGPILIGVLPITGHGFGGDTGLTYIHTRHQEMLLRQSLGDEHFARGSRRTLRTGLTMLAAGFSLLFLGLAVAG